MEIYAGLPCESCHSKNYFFIGLFEENGENDGQEIQGFKCFNCGHHSVGNGFDTEGVIKEGKPRIE